MSSIDYYTTLGVSKGASGKDIKSAYRKLAMQYHPDKNKGDKISEEKFKEINQAYAVLSDKNKRQQYDMFGSEKFHQRYSQEDIFRGFDIGDILRGFGFSSRKSGGLEDLFGGGGFGFRDISGMGSRKKGRDVTHDFHISFLEAAIGGEKKISFRTHDGGIEEVSVKLPPGIDTGKKLRLAGKGEQGIRGAPPGDLYLNILVQRDPVFQRKGNDIFVTKEITFTKAALGTNISVPTLERIENIVKVPPGTQPGTKIRIRGQGIKRLRGIGRGDLYVQINVLIPKKINRRHKKILEELARDGL